MAKNQNVITAEDVEATLEIIGEKEQGARESDNKFAIRIARVVADATEEEWNELPKAVQEWFNNAADALNEDNPNSVAVLSSAKGKDKAPAKKDAGDAAEEEVEVAVKDLEVGDFAILILKDGEEVEGEVEKMLTNRVTIGGEKYPFTKVVECYKLEGTDDTGEEPEEGSEEAEREVSPKELQEGDNAVLVMKDDKEMEGEVVGVSARAVVLLDDDGETRVSFAKVATAYVIEGDGASDEKEEEEEPEEKPKRGRGAKGGGIGAVIRAKLVDDPTLDPDTIMDQLEEEGVEFKETTVKLTVNAFTEIYKALDEAGMIVGGSEATEKEEEEKPKRGRGTSKKAPARRGGRIAKKEEEEEEKPKRGRGASKKTTPRRASGSTGRGASTGRTSGRTAKKKTSSRRGGRCG